MPETASCDKESFDKFLSAHVSLTIDDGLKDWSVIGRNHDQDGNPVSCGSANPLLNTITYGVEFQDRCIQEYLVNKIAEKMCAQVDTEGNQIFNSGDLQP